MDRGIFFNLLDDDDWSFLESTALVGLQAPDLEGDMADVVMGMVERRTNGSHYTQEQASLLREAVEIGWNVATENGTNELVGKHRRVAEALGVEFQGVATPAP